MGINHPRFIQDNKGLFFKLFLPLFKKVQKVFRSKQSQKVESSTENELHQNKMTLTKDLYQKKQIKQEDKFQRALRKKTFEKSFLNRLN